MFFFFFLLNNILFSNFKVMILDLDKVFYNSFYGIKILNSIKLKNSKNNLEIYNFYSEINLLNSLLFNLSSENIVAYTKIKSKILLIKKKILFLQEKNIDNLNYFTDLLNFLINQILFDNHFLIDNVFIINKNDVNFFYFNKKIEITDIIINKINIYK